MKSLHRRGSLVVITLFIVPLLSAATYVVPDDETFIRRAELIVSGTVLDSWSQLDANGRIETIYRLAVDEVLKGEAGEILELREWGGVVGDRWMATSAGIHYETGKRYVVFGRQLPDARWTTLDFGLGQFSFVRQQDVEFIVRDRSEIYGWDREGRIHREHPRETQRFLQKIHNLSSLSPASIGDDPTPVSEVNNLDHATAAAIGASQWSSGSVVNYSVSGTPASGNTMNEFDGQDRIIIDDPENLIPGTFTGSGTLAIAFFGGQALPGRLNITGSDIVVQNGVSSSTLSQNSYNSMMTHEMGHTLGFRHSDQNKFSHNNTTCDAGFPCSGSAIMTATVVGGLNGNLQSWDLDARQNNYASSSSFDVNYLVHQDGDGRAWHRGSPVTTWFIAAPAVSTCTGPTITAQPTAQPSTINSGQSSQLSVSATASEGNLTYQWFRGNSGQTANPIGTGSSISVSPTMTTNYWVRVTDQCNGSTSVNSNTVTVTVQAGCQGPTITQQPTATPSLINAGQSSQLSVAATASEGNLSYQWFQGTSGSGTPISGGTSATINVSPTTTTNYWVRVTDQCNGSTSVNSNTVTVTVCEPAFLISEPVDTSVESGKSTTLSVTAGGTATLNYQWYRGTTGDTSTPVGTNSRFFTTPNLTQQTTYWVRVSNSCGQANSRTVTVSVTAACEPPQITQQPQSVTIGTGTSATLTVQATGTALSYQWFEVQGSTQTPISGATSPTLVTPALTATKTYFVRISNSCGQVNSAQATVTVTTCAPPAITNQPQGTKIVATQSATLSVSASGTATLRYQWFIGQSGDTSRPITGASGPSLTTEPLRETTRFWVRISNDCGTVNSATATVEVEPARRRPVGRRG